MCLRPKQCKWQQLSAWKEQEEIGGSADQRQYHPSAVTADCEVSQFRGVHQVLEQDKCM